MNRTAPAPANGTADQTAVEEIPLPARLVVDLHAYLNERPRKETNGFATAIESAIQRIQARARAEQPPAVADDAIVAEAPVDTEAEG